MFEKDAEEDCNETFCSVCENVTCAFEGIKCREWRDRRAGFYCGAEFGYNKANEWHYVKDGLPEELHDVICFVIHNEHRYVLQGYLREGRWVLSPLGTYLNNDDVIAWKEIVLPELPKEIE